MRSMVERDSPMGGKNALNSGSSLSDPAPPGHLSLRERADAQAWVIALAM